MIFRQLSRLLTTPPKTKLFSRHDLSLSGGRFSKKSLHSRTPPRLSRNQQASTRIIFTRTLPASFTDTPHWSSIVTSRIRNVTQLELVSGNQNKDRPKMPSEFKNIEKLSKLDTAMALDSNSLHCAFKGLHTQL